ncbi:MAG: HAMP domain-containing histidine kinase, partial [Patescibacteria group bacterium]|nr:HAMP domain-containing histidine kinase [Patescibacteria group bacterium]
LDIQKDNPSIVDIINRVPKDHNFTDKIDRVMTTNNLLENKEMQIKDKTVQVIITPVPNIGATVLLHDITLEKNIAKTKENFTYMVVHELRAPLTAIRGASSLMVSGSSQKLNDEERVKMLKIINEQSKQLLEEIASLLDAAKIEAGRFTINKTSTNIRELIQKRIQFYTPYAQDKKMTLTAGFENNLPEVMVDPIRIEQVVNNLISNSLKFTPEGGKIMVDVKTNRKIASQASQGVPLQGKNEIIISVSDTGIGIPKEKQPLLFTRFSQVAYPQMGEKPTLIPSGTGLGLYIVKGIVEAHGGTVSFESELNKGTTVSFSLPT